MAVLWEALRVGGGIGALMGLIFAFVFLPQGDFGSDGDGGMSKAPCEVLSNTGTGYSDAGGVLREIVFEHSEGQGTAYVYDTELMGPTTCMLPNDAPDRIRPVGARVRPFGPEILSVLIFLVGGLGLIVLGTVMKRRHIAKIMDGID